MEYMSPTECPACCGKRLKPESLAVRVKGVGIAELTSMPIARALPSISDWSTDASAKSRSPPACSTRSGTGWSIWLRSGWTI